MGFNLWWARNDGIGGHAWLGADDMRALAAEMDAQGMRWPGDRHRVSAADVDEALVMASREPRTDIDGRLWDDWLTFLEGARENGGIVVR